MSNGFSDGQSFRRPFMSCWPTASLPTGAISSKAEFLQQIGAAKFEDVSPEAEDRFWNQYPFQFAEQAESLKLKWE
jgi:hypothetical protein